MFDFSFLQDKLFLRELENHPIKELFIKIELLDFKERTIGEIQGKCISGSLNVDGNSSVRRTCSFAIAIDENTYDLASLDNTIAINKKIRLFVGYKNFINGYSHYGDILWFPLGIFIMVAPSITNGIGGSTLSVSAKDKMCLLNGEVAGSLPAPVSLHEKYTRVGTGDEQTTTIEPVLIYDIIREAVIHLGGEDPSKVIINDIPLKTKKLLRYIGNTPLYYDDNWNPETPEAATRVIEHGDLAGYDWVDFAFPGELIKQAGEPITAILDSIKNALGNFEYFYDVDGNFVFQEIKNYLNTSYRPITELNNDDFMVNFGESYLAHSFKDSNIISSYSNTPNWLNIKNDFIVWGKRKTTSGAEVPIRYHVAIDDIPEVPTEFGDIPWQVYLYKYGEEALAAGTDRGYYHRELQNEIPKLYDLENNRWKKLDPSSMDFFLDFIDSKSEFGKFSIDAIGRRTKVITDDNVSMLYRPEVPDVVILDVYDKDEETLELLEELNKKGQDLILVNNRKAYTYAGIGKDAFSVVREMIMNHTSYSESINISALPIYYLEPNVRIEVEDKQSNIYGDYIITSISLPLSHEGVMSIGAVRATNRI